jgi:PAS domain S-box-containing protein
MSLTAVCNEALRAENIKLRARLEKMEEMLRAIRAGEVDALVVKREIGPQFFTLQGLDARQNRFRGEILAQVWDVVIAVDLEDRITFLNAGAEQHYRVRACDMLGCKLDVIVTRHWASPQLEAEAWAALHKHGEWRGEYLERMPDGRDMYVDSSITALHDSHGESIGFIAVIRDITERRRLEESLREQAELFSTLIEQAPMGTYVVDARLRIQQVNAQALPVFASIQPLIGRDFREVIQILWGPELGDQIAHIFRHTLETGERYISPPFTQKRHDLGVEQTYEWQTQRVTLPNRLYGVVCFFHEITERERATAALRASEQRMRLATEATQVGIWEWNILTNQIRWDAALFRMYGIPPTPDGLVDYSDWSNAVVPDDLVENETILKETIRHCGRSARTFRICRRDDGECRLIAAVETVRTNAQGQAEWVVGTNLDITERQHGEDELRRLATELSEVDRRKDEFLATLAHELRNPMAAIRNGLQIMRLTKGIGAEAEKALIMIERQFGQMVHLVDDLLDVSRILQGKLILRKRPIELAAALNNALETCRSLIEASGNELVVVVPPQPIFVDADMTRLEQVLINLLNNAAKYTETGGCIRVAVEGEGDDVKVSVKDNGVGISPEMLPKIFEIFAQAEQAQDGLGIGLSLVKQLIELHGGSVEAISEGIGKGSEFVIRLPVVSSEVNQVTPATYEPGPACSSGKFRILVADDNRDSADSLAMLLTLMGNDVRTANDGAEAVDMAYTFRPEVILLDIGMPKLNGYEACRRLREQPGGETLVIIALTGWGQDEDKRRSMAAGFDHHMVKPVDTGALEKLLAGLLPRAECQINGSSDRRKPENF